MQNKKEKKYVLEEMEIISCPIKSKWENENKQSFFKYPEMLQSLI